MDNRAPKGITPKESDIGRAVVYRAAPDYRPEQGTMSDHPESKNACQARDRRVVFMELMDCRRPRSEHEHEAARVIACLMDALKACADDLEICVEQEYAPLAGYPSYGRKRYRDLEPVRNARELLDLYKQTY